jgi:predicted permease
MPVGANVFLFATRYRVGEAEVSLSLSLSVLVAMVTVPGLMALQPTVTQWLRP